MARWALACVLLAAAPNRLATQLGVTLPTLPPAVPADLAALHEVHDRGDPGGNRPQSRPMIRRQDHNRQFAIREALLVADVLVAGDQDIKPSLFGCIEQCSILKTLPAQFAGHRHLMAPKRPGERGWSVGVEQDPHAAAAGGSRDLCAK